MIDHLFRHQYGKMVSILTRIFGLQHLETIEDAVQDTFVVAMKSWQGQVPENPQAWLTQAAKNRTIDLFRKLSSEDVRIKKMEAGVTTIAIHELFLDHEMEDSILRMIFTACNDALNPKDQIAFALKTISGFSGKEIATALLLKEETVRKRLARARGLVQTKDIPFEIPQGVSLQHRLNRVLEVIYLIFNEGFHSGRKDMLVREDLCGEALRLTKMLQGNQLTATPSVYALFALFCFQSARLGCKTSDDNEIISLKDQDRSKWDKRLVALGNSAMYRAVETDDFGYYHYEAAIAAEHVMASSYEETNWDKILRWYEALYQLDNSPFNLLNMAVVQLQRKDFQAVVETLDKIEPSTLEQRMYLYYGTYAEYYHVRHQKIEAIEHVKKAIASVENSYELSFLQKKKEKYEKA